MFLWGYQVAVAQQCKTATFEHNSKRNGGEIVTVDHRGGRGCDFYDPEEWTYDIQATDCPYKHIPEQNIIG